MPLVLGGGSPPALDNTIVAGDAVRKVMQMPAWVTPNGDWAYQTAPLHYAQLSNVYGAAADVTLVSVGVDEFLFLVAYQLRTDITWTYEIRLGATQIAYGTSVSTDRVRVLLPMPGINAGNVGDDLIIRNLAGSATAAGSFYYLLYDNTNKWFD